MHKNTLLGFEESWEIEVPDKQCPITNMFCTGSQLCQICNWMHVMQRGDQLHNGTFRCPTQLLVAIPIHNRMPSSYATGWIILTSYVTVLSHYVAGHTVLLLKWTEEIASVCLSHPIKQTEYELRCTMIDCSILTNQIDL